MLLTSSMAISIMFFFMKHPLSMGLSLLLQSIIIAMMTGYFSYNFWYSYILFLIMVGGMLVLFIYMTSIASNEMFKYSNKLMMFMFSMMSLMMIIYFFMDSYIYNILSFNLDLSTMSNYTLFSLSLNKFLNLPSSIILFLLIIYLFVTLIAVVKITNIKYGPLRQT